MKDSENKEKQVSEQSNTRLSVIITLVVLALGIIVTLLFYKNWGGKSAAESLSSSVTTYSNGDIVYRPGTESMAYDEDDSIIYYNNLLIIYLFSDLSEVDARTLASSVNGTVVGDISGAINVLQILVDESSLEQLNLYADKLMESDDVLYATYEMPLSISESAISDNNPWNDDTENPEPDRGNEDNPTGNDWWAEAIGAYAAWNYIDSHPDIISPITVGIIDNGFDEEHDEFRDRIAIQNINTIDSEKDSPNHGTHVAGIIVANNDDIGIRGVADSANLICADFSPVLGAEENLLDVGEYLEITKQLIESDAKVINNSWGYALKSEEVFKNAFIEENLDFLSPLYKLIASTDTEIAIDNLYDAYFSYVEAMNKRTAAECIAMMLELMINGHEDFLIVQCAGNGLNFSGPGIDASYIGYYAAINKDIYQQIISNKAVQKLEQFGINYESVKQRLLIVGAVENVRDENNGNYIMTTYSNYGETVNICAPGGGIPSETNDQMQIYSTFVDSYGYLSGTSMAAPMVSGAAALIWSIAPNLTAEEVQDILLKNYTVDAIGVRNGIEYTYPMLNVGSAVRAVVGGSTKVNFERFYEEFYEYAILTGVDDSGNVIWTYQTDKYMGADLDRVNEIAIRDGRYYFVEDGTIIALNISDGTVIWKNDSFSGGSPSFTFGDDGTLYICGYYGPDFLAVDKDGNTLKRIDSFDSDYFWPYQIDYLGNRIAITFEGCTDWTVSQTKFCVNLDDFSYYKEESQYEDNSVTGQKEHGNPNIIAQISNTFPDSYPYTSHLLVTLDDGIIVGEVSDYNSNSYGVIEMGDLTNDGQDEILVNVECVGSTYGATDVYVYTVDGTDLVEILHLDSQEIGTVYSELLYGTGATIEDGCLKVEGISEWDESGFWETYSNILIKYQNGVWIRSDE